MALEKVLRGPMTRCFRRACNGEHKAHISWPKPIRTRGTVALMVKWRRPRVDVQAKPADVCFEMRVGRARVAWGEAGPSILVDCL